MQFLNFLILAKLPYCHGNYRRANQQRWSLWAGNASNVLRFVHPRYQKCFRFMRDSPGNHPFPVSELERLIWIMGDYWIIFSLRDCSFLMPGTGQSEISKFQKNFLYPMKIRLNIICVPWKYWEKFSYPPPSKFCIM